MSYRQLMPYLAVLATLCLFGLASFVPWESMWGVNHLSYLPQGFTYGYLLIAAAILCVMLRRSTEHRFTAAVVRIDDWLWGGRHRPRLMLAAFSIAVFYLLRVQTHFLGDGYSWLGVFGAGEGYYHKWTEYGSILVVRKIQTLLGGYDAETAMATFRLLSVISGGIVVNNIVIMAGHIGRSASTRVFALSTLLLSGAMLLFFGYVEFYPLLWAAATTFVCLSLRYIRSQRWLILPILAFALSCFVHLQALFFMPGLAYLMAYRHQSKRGREVKLKSIAAVFAVAALIGGLVFMWLYSTRIEFEVMFLPLVTGRANSPDYALLTVKHLIDLLNELLLVFPGVVVLLAMWLSRRRPTPVDPASVLLGLLSIGSLVFFVMVDPVLGIGRDWDMMSLSLLAPILLLVRRVSIGNEAVSARSLVVYGLLSGFLTITFLAVSIAEVPAADRCHSLLRLYGAKNRSGWANYVSYLKDNEDEQAYYGALAEMDRLYPDYHKLREVYDLIGKGKYAEARRLAEELVDRQPYNGDFLQVLGNVYSKLGDDERSLGIYRRAVRLKANPVILNELGQLHIKLRQYAEAIEVFKRARRKDPERSAYIEGLALAHVYLGQLDAASLLADTLFIRDPDSPGGHALSMVIALNRGDYTTAKQHFRQYLEYGKGRSDYTRMRDHYRYLLD